MFAVGAHINIHKGVPGTDVLSLPCSGSNGFENNFVNTMPKKSENVEVGIIFLYLSRLGKSS